MAGYRTYGASGDGTQGYGGRTLKELADMVHGSKAEFVRRLEDPARAHIRDWDPGRHGTASFKLAWTDGGDGRAYVYPMVQEVDGELVDFTDPEVQRARMVDPQLGGWLNALESGDYVEMTPEEAEHFTNHYKEWYRGGDSWGANPADADYDIDLSWLGGDPKNARYLNYAMRKLLRMGYGGAQVAALLGSMAEESGGDPYAVGDGGLAEGLLQWHPDRYRTSVLSDADPFMEIDRQLEYLDKSLRSSDDTVSWTHGGAGSGYRTAKEAMDDWAAARDLWHAVRALTYGYVRPKDAAARAGSRYRLADRILAELAERKWAREGKEFDRELSERREARLKMRGELEEKLRDSPLLPVPEKDGVAQEQPQTEWRRDALDHNLDDPYTMVGIPSGTEWSLWDSDAAQREWAGSIGLPDPSGLHRSGGRLARRHGDGGEKGGGAFDAQGMQREWAAQLGLPDYSQADYATEPYSDADAIYGGTLQPAVATAKMTREDVANAVRGGNVTLDWVARTGNGNPEDTERIALYAASHPEYKDYIGKDGRVDLSELRRKDPELFDKLMAETDAELTASADANGDPLANMYATGWELHNDYGFGSWLRNAFRRRSKRHADDAGDVNYDAYLGEIEPSVVTASKGIYGNDDTWAVNSMDEFMRQVLYQMEVPVYYDSLDAYPDTPEIEALKGMYKKNKRHPQKLIGELNKIAKRPPLPAKPLRMNYNSSPTLEDSMKIEDRANDKMYDGYFVNTGERDTPNVGSYHVEKAPQFAVPLIGNYLNANGYHVTANQLDSLAKYAGMAGIPAYEGIGLAAQETHFGEQPYFNYGEPMKDIKEWNRSLGNSNYLKAYGSVPAEALVRDFRYSYDDVPATTPPLLHAFKYYKEGMYNRGDRNHTTDVRNVGLKVFNSPEVQEWWKDEGREYYNLGKKQR